MGSSVPGNRISYAWLSSWIKTDSDNLVYRQDRVPLRELFSTNVYHNDGLTERDMLLVLGEPEILGLYRVLACVVFSYEYT